MKRIGSSFILVISALFLACALLAKISSAALYFEEMEYEVFVNGVSYGTFTDVQGFDQKPISKISMERVRPEKNTLFGLLKKDENKRHLLSEITVQKKTKRGMTIQTYYLTNVRPLDWSFEILPDQGGIFKEHLSLEIGHYKIAEH